MCSCSQPDKRCGQKDINGAGQGVGWASWPVDRFHSRVVTDQLSPIGLRVPADTVVPPSTGSTTPVI